MRVHHGGELTATVSELNTSDASVDSRAPDDLVGPSSEVRALRGNLNELTDALVSANDQLLALYQLAGFSTGSLEPATATDRALLQARELLRAESVALLTSNDAGGASVTARVGIGAAGSRALLGNTTIGAPSRIDRDPSLGDREQLSAPVKIGERVFGTLVARSESGTSVNTGDLMLLEAVAGHLAVILELSELHQETIRTTIIERDHDTASALAQAALNRPLPQAPGVDVAARSIPARLAGGDFFAVAQSSNGIYAALGDVSGKGLPAALVMTTAISATQAAFNRTSTGDVGEVLADIDGQLADHLAETGMFITMAIAHLDTTTGELQTTNSGQSPVLLVRAGHAGDANSQASSITVIPADAPPIGVLDPSAHAVSRWTLEPGDTLVIGSDGCTDQSNHGGQMIGEDRFNTLLTPPDGRDWASAAEMLDNVLDGVMEFGEGAPQDDDLTAVVLRPTGTTVMSDHRSTGSEQ